MGLWACPHSRGVVAAPRAPAEKVIRAGATWAPRAQHATRSLVSLNLSGSAPFSKDACGNGLILRPRLRFRPSTICPAFIRVHGSLRGASPALVVSTSLRMSVSTPVNFVRMEIHVS